MARKEIPKNIVENKETAINISNEPPTIRNEKTRKTKINEYFKTTTEGEKKVYVEKRPEKDKELKRKVPSKEKKQIKEEMLMKRKGYWTTLADKMKEKKNLDKTIVKQDVSLVQPKNQIQCNEEWPTIGNGAAEQPTRQNEAASRIISTNSDVTTQDKTCSNPLSK